MIKWIIFDIMGVMFKDSDDVKQCLIPFLKSKDITFNQDNVYKKYKEASLGMITSAKFWECFGLENLDQEYLSSSLRFDNESLRIPQKYKNEFSFAIISNDVAEWSKILRNMYKIDNYFSHSVISGDVGIRKPDLEIYNIFLDKTNALPEECIFIDDNIKNLKAAKKLGIYTIYFNRNQGIENEYLDCDYVINNWSQIQQIIEQI
ncbi:HAD family hydrolase [Halonatronum saccharophilum]|uniref:HAD family hydrolase n=1 Tax=Halonatronum saccharophilum TaxID=150060 RepID=UPI0004810A2F|nr:HAD-IA family hydrolase [Halonatronum saccharophilum]